MLSRKLSSSLFFSVLLAIAGCTTIKESALPQGVKLPENFTSSSDTMNNNRSLKSFFADAKLQRLIDTALSANFDLQAALQQVEMARANVRIANVATLPEVDAIATTSIDRYSKYSVNGVGNFDTNLSPNIDKKQRIPNPTPDFFLGFRSSWEIDIWGKLKDRKRAAYTRYLASREGRKWLATEIAALVAARYYELMALDDQLRIIQHNIELQKKGLEIVEAQMAGGRATALAVRQFKAQLLHTQGAEVVIQQSIIRTENELNALLGRFPVTVNRDSSIIAKMVPEKIQAGIPSEILLRRPDIQQAELGLIAAKADVSAARKALLPSLNINPYIGLNAFKLPLVFSGASLAAGAVSSLAGPIINRGALISGVNIANAQQATAFYHYQQKIVQAYQEVVTLMRAIENMEKLYKLKVEEVKTLREGVATANDLYLAGYASYLEVIVAQGNVLQAEMEQVDIKRDIFTSVIGLYRALGGV